MTLEYLIFDYYKLINHPEAVFLNSNSLVSCLGPFFIDNSNYLLIILRKDGFLIFTWALSCKNPKGICWNLNCMFLNFIMRLFLD